MAIQFQILVMAESLFRQLLQRALAPRHHFARRGHLRIEIGLSGGKLDPARSGDDRECAANLDIEMVDHRYAALEGADALCVVTEWSEYRTPDFDYLKHKMAAPVIFDGRNLYQPAQMAARGICYQGIGLKTVPVVEKC